MERFYGKARHDQILGPIFVDAIGDQWDSHLATMQTFWCTVMFNTGTYKGNPLAAHMRLPGLTERHFRRWLSLWRETVAEVCGSEGTLFVCRAEAIGERLLAAVSLRDTHIQIAAKTRNREARRAE